MFHGLTTVWKFIPYTPTINVSGINTALMMVSTFMISLSRLLTEDR